MRCVQRLENFLAETLWYYDPIVQHYYIVNDMKILAVIPKTRKMIR